MDGCENPQKRRGKCTTHLRLGPPDQNGYCLDEQGYKVRWITVDGKRRLEREHRVVMEQVLGRKLLPGENVHHRNGNRSDNAPSNLSLWVVMQPSGQEPADLVKYAKEILNRYGGPGSGLYI